MKIQIALVFLLYLQGSCICAESRRRHNHATGKNLTTVSPSKEINQPESIVTSESSSTTPTAVVIPEEISTTPRKTTGRSAPRRNRTRQRVTTHAPKSTTEELTTTEIVLLTSTEDETTEPAPELTTDYFATEEVTTNEVEVPTTTPTLQADSTNSTITQENRSSHCSNECAALRRSNAVRYSPLLAKLIHRFSKPGAFEKGKSAFEEEAEPGVTLCPPGDIGLSCRQAEARKGAEECYGGNCEECRTCDEKAVTKWPHCCRDSFRCCSQLALACQQCDKPDLQSFCSKHFKRCS